VSEPQREPKIIDDKVNGVVIIDGVRVSGFVDDRLGECLHPRIYSDRYDAYFCATEDRWLEGACSDESCDYCRDRPAHPLVVALDEPERGN
jgi:hypothetical protein